MPTGHYDHTSRRINLAGQTIGYAYVQKLNHRAHDESFWECRCLYKNCGRIFVRSHHRLMEHKDDANCGCLCREKGRIRQKEYFADKGIKNLPHGKRINEIHHGMVQRCTNPNNREYVNYGGRGITICEEWLNDKKAFYEWSIAHGYADDLTIDRIDVNGNYCPENCRWVDMFVQNSNQRNTIKYEYQGEYLSVTELARKVNISEGVLRTRLQKGYSIERAIIKFNEQNGKPVKGYEYRKRK